MCIIFCTHKYDLLYIKLMKEQITYDIFDKVDIRVGTVLSVKKNERARKPSLIIEVDFGKEIGIKQSSAQITHYYNEENLKGKQVIGVCNFLEKNIAGVKSQVLILGSIDKEGKVILVHPSQESENGLPIA
jgi:tRNA-binding protein